MRFGLVVSLALLACSRPTSPSSPAPAPAQPPAPPRPQVEMLPDDATPASLCVDLDKQRGKRLGLGDVEPSPGQRKAQPDALRELARVDRTQLPGWQAGEGEVLAVAIADTNGDGARELYVDYRVSAGEPTPEAFNLAALSIPD